VLFELQHFNVALPLGLSNYVNDPTPTTEGSLCGGKCWDVIDLARQFTLGHDKIKRILEIDPKIRTIAAQLGAFMMPQAPSTSSGKN
jgi:hypothetical protein